ncbi:MAG TPA: diacylglycerol kinase family protein, partial [Methylocella sp.]|nr:diacylglycerol kinase family protein [Methylocella sp.]
MAQKQATIIYNPMSGRPGRRASKAAEMVRLLGERGISAQAHATAGPNDATRLARVAVAAGRDIIVSYGGDGTLNEVIQGMAGSQASLAVWAGGTANVVARDLGMPVEINRLADVIAAGKTKRIALGRARKAGEQGGKGAGELSPLAQTPDVRYFIMFAGIGLDASIARRVNRKLKRATGEFAYWVEGIRHLLAWQAEAFEIEVDGKKYESAFALIGNGKGYGGGFSLTPNARLEDPSFEVYI